MHEKDLIKFTEHREHTEIDRYQERKPTNKYSNESVENVLSENWSCQVFCVRMKHFHSPVWSIASIVFQYVSICVINTIQHLNVRSIIIEFGHLFLKLAKLWKNPNRMTNVSRTAYFPINPHPYQCLTLCGGKCIRNKKKNQKNYALLNYFPHFEHKHFDRLIHWSFP